MFPPIENSADCEIHAAIGFLYAFFHIKTFFLCCALWFSISKNIKTVKIHRQTSEVYKENKWAMELYRNGLELLKTGKNVHDQERNRRPSIINEDMVQKVDERVRQT